MISSLLAFSGPPIGHLDLPLWLGVTVGFFLVLLNGFFVAAEFALVKVRPTQIEPFVTARHRRGRVAAHMIEHLDAYLSATQLGITLASLSLGWIGEPAFALLLEPVFRLLPGLSDDFKHTMNLAVAFACISLLHIVLGELAPKSLAIRKPTPTSLWVALPLFAFYKLAFPAIWILNHSANALLRIFGIQPVSEGGLIHSEEEIRRLLASSHRSRLPEHKRELLGNVLELSQRVARQVMVPRTEVVYLDTTWPLEKSLELARRSGHTRFPLCEGSLDHTVGLVHIKDLFRSHKLPDSLTEMRRDIAFIPETFPLDRLLRRMRGRHIHLAAVLDEYGSVSGIVSLENVIEKIVGEIQDEFDAERPEVVKLEENVYQVSGSLLLDDLQDEFDVDIDVLNGRDEDTIAGVMLSEIGRRARVGDRAEVGVLQLEVLEVKGNRIQTLKLSVRPEEPVDQDRPQSAEA